MNTNPKALIAVLCLLGETENSIAEEYLFKRQPNLPDHRRAFAPKPGEPGYVPPYFPEWATEQHQQDLILLQQFAWERVWAEMQKVARLLAERPELSRDAEFVAYQRAVSHVVEVIAGNCEYTPGHRIGSWPEDSQ